MTAPANNGDVTIEQLEAQPYIGIRETIAVAELGAAMGERFTTLAAFLAQRGVQPAGAPFVRYFSFGDSETDFLAGIPVAAPIDGEGRIAGGELPGGAALTTLHLGAHDRLGEAYERINAALAQPGVEAAGQLWEVYDWLDPARANDPASFGSPDAWRTSLVQPIRQV